MVANKVDRANKKEPEKETKLSRRTDYGEYIIEKVLKRGDVVYIFYPSKKKVIFTKKTRDLSELTSRDIGLLLEFREQNKILEKFEPSMAFAFVFKKWLQNAKVTKDGKKRFNAKSFFDYAHVANLPIFAPVSYYAKLEPYSKIPYLKNVDWLSPQFPLLLAFGVPLMYSYLHLDDHMYSNNLGYEPLVYGSAVQWLTVPFNLQWWVSDAYYDWLVSTGGNILVVSNFIDQVKKRIRNVLKEQIKNPIELEKKVHEETKNLIKYLTILAVKTFFTKTILARSETHIDFIYILRLIASYIFSYIDDDNSYILAYQYFPHVKIIDSPSKYSVKITNEILAPEGEISIFSDDSVSFFFTGKGSEPFVIESISESKLPKDKAYDIKFSTRFRPDYRNLAFSKLNIVTVPVQIIEDPKEDKHPVGELIVFHRMFNSKLGAYEYHVFPVSTVLDDSKKLFEKTMLVCPECNSRNIIIKFVSDFIEAIDKDERLNTFIEKYNLSDLFIKMKSILKFGYEDALEMANKSEYDNRFFVMAKMPIRYMTVTAVPLSKITVSTDNFTKGETVVSEIMLLIKEHLLDDATKSLLKRNSNVIVTGILLSTDKGIPILDVINIYPTSNMIQVEKPRQNVDVVYSLVKQSLTETKLRVEDLLQNFLEDIKSNSPSIEDEYYALKVSLLLQIASLKRVGYISDMPGKLYDSLRNIFQEIDIENLPKQHRLAFLKDEPIRSAIDRPQIHILLIGPTGSGKTTVLRKMQYYVPNYAYVQAGTLTIPGLIGRVDRTSYGWTFTPGALFTANNGLLILDEVDKIKTEVINSLLNAMEDQKITITKAFLSSDIDLNFAVLAAGNPINQHEWIEGLGVLDQIKLPPVFVSRFDLIFPLLYGAGKKEDLVSNLFTGIYSKVMNFSSPDSYELQYNTREMLIKSIYEEIERKLSLKKYLFVASRVRIKDFSNDARVVLGTFFEEMAKYFKKLAEEKRKKVELEVVGALGNDDLKEKKKEKTADILLTVRVIPTIFRIAIASAKLRLSPVVEEVDARLAITLMKSMLNIYKVTGVDAVYTSIDRVSENSFTRAIIQVLSERDAVTKSELFKLVFEKLGINDERVIKLSIDKLERVLNNLIYKGYVYEPQPGVYKLIKGPDFNF